MSDGSAPATRWRWLRRALVGLVVTYAVICGAVFLLQGALLFHPTSLDAAEPAEPRGQPLELAVDGAVLRGVIVPGRGEGPRPTLLYFGGNAERVRQRARERGWVGELGFHQVFVSYRGYDDSTGSPSGAALLADAVAIHDAIAARPDVDRERIVVWGNSLGSGIAARVARERALAGAILVMPYARLSDIAADVYWWLPVRWLFRHEIDTLADAPAITDPVLVVHGRLDTLIPPAHGRRVAEAWGGPARLVLVDGAGHNDLGGRPELRAAVEAFLREVATGSPPDVAPAAPVPLAPPAPSIVPSAPPPPAVARALAALSPTRLRADVDALAAFVTRHTLSADAPDRGIAAARGYLVAQLQAAVVPSRTGAPLSVAVETFALQPDGRRIDRPATLANVVATLPGTMPQAADRRVYVLGHYDSRASDVMDPEAPAPGANDDASGVAVTLELARVLAGEPLDATVVFMATAGEEQGLLGARLHAVAAREAGVRITAVLSNDIVGDPSSPAGVRHDHAIRVFSSDVSLSLPPAALAELRKSGSLADGPSRQLARHVAMVGTWERTPVQPVLVYRPDRFLRGGDHLAFDEQGFAAVRLTEVAEDYDRQHQDPRTEGTRRLGDWPEHVDAHYLAEVARLNGAALVHLANAPSAPAEPVVVAVALTTDTTLRWPPAPEPDVAGYEVVWRPTTSPTWEHAGDVGLATEVTLPLAKDDFVFGVRTYDRDGYRSPVAACGTAPARP